MGQADEFGVGGERLEVDLVADVAAAVQGRGVVGGGGVGAGEQFEGGVPVGAVLGGDAEVEPGLAVVGGELDEAAPDLLGVVAPAALVEGVAEVEQGVAVLGGVAQALVQFALDVGVVGEGREGGDDKASSGTNYAQARYVCHYLQEHGLLREFYRQFVATAAVEPTGRTLLAQMVGYIDIDRFDADWRQYALGLAYG